MENFYKDKTILITGGCGSIGSEIIRQLIKFKPKTIRIFDSSEEGLFHIQNELKEYHNIRYLLGNIRDKERLRFAIKGVDIVFHAAALKHVPLCEYNPFEAVQTNVVGTQNIVEVSREENVDKVISISTDKAVNPINTMGATKLLSEKLILGGRVGALKTKFSCVRFGNVLNSSGSVIPLFKEQIENGGPITITSKNMTRFFMTIGQAVELVLKAGMMTEGEEIFILKMNSLRIVDLAEVLIENSNKKIPIEIIGKRPGEKLYEILINDEEAPHVSDLGEMYVLKNGFSTPHMTESGIDGKMKEEYHSGNTKMLTKIEIKKILKDDKIL